MAKIMIVDDDESHRRIVEVALRRASGYSVVSCSNGPDALSRIVAEDPDLILLDIMMPGMNGFEVCKRIRSMPEVKAVSIIILSAKSEIEDKLRGGYTGADDYLVKPFSPMELLSRIGTQLRIRELETLIGTSVSRITALMGELLEKADSLKACIDGEDVSPDQCVDGIRERAKRIADVLDRMYRNAGLDDVAVDQSGRARSVTDPSSDS